MWLNIVQWFKQRDYAWKFKLVVCLPIFSVLVLFDWVTKWVIVNNLSHSKTMDFIPGFLRFNYVINPGAAYGMNSNNPVLAIVLATIVTFILVLFFLIANDKKWLIALCFLLAGSFANLLARAWAPAVASGPNAGMYGGVVDFLQWEFSIFKSREYIFNLADVWVIFGIVILLIVLLIELFTLVIPKKPKTDSFSEVSEDQSKKKE